MTMDINVSIALIAAFSACLGALIPSLFSYFGKKVEYENDSKAKLEEIRRKACNDFIDALQTMINSSNRDSFLALQTSTNKLLLFAGPELSILVNKYFNDLVQRTNQYKPLTLEEQVQYQTKIYNAMRKELGVSSDKTDNINKVSLIRV